MWGIDANFKPEGIPTKHQYFNPPQDLLEVPAVLRRRSINGDNGQHALTYWLFIYLQCLQICNLNYDLIFCIVQ